MMLKQVFSPLDLLTKLLADFGLQIAMHEVSLSAEIQEIKTALDSAVYYGAIADLYVHKCYYKK